MPNNPQFDLLAGAAARVSVQDSDAEQRQTRRRGALVSVRSPAGLSSSTPVYYDSAHTVRPEAVDRTLVVTPVDFSVPTQGAIAQAGPRSFVLRTSPGDAGCTHLACASHDGAASTWDVVVCIRPAP